MKRLLGSPAESVRLEASILDRLERENARLRAENERLASTAAANEQATERELARFFAMSLDLLCIASIDGFLKRVSPSWTRVLGWTEEELLSRPSLEFVHPDDRQATADARGRLKAGSPLVAFTNRYLCKDGGVRFIDWRSMPAPEQGLVYCAARDITEQREAERQRDDLRERLIVADRMISVGTLAAGVAHEINNPLTCVISNLDVMVEQLRELAGGSSAGATTDLEEMGLEARQGAERVRMIVRGLKTFARNDEERRVVMDVKPALELAIGLALHEIRTRAILVREYGVTPLIEADDGRLGQVFVNLLINAAQAIGSKAIHEGAVDANEIRIVTSTDDSGAAVIEVRDTGPGIPEAALNRVFEPFFTTKPVGVGTGLGLSICHNIVTGLGGTISATSQQGRGTTIRVMLPAAPVHTSTASVTEVATTSASTRRGAVLVVDDEPAVGSALRRVLGGHDVTLVGSAQQALELLSDGRRFDVILSDLMMPQMNGIEFHGELARRSPEDAAKIVFVTAGASTQAAADFLDRVDNERISKPFTPQIVREVVRRRLG